jgi:hypothetical protein
MRVLGLRYIAYWHRLLGGPVTTLLGVLDLDEESTLLNGVDEDVARLEASIARPAADELEDAATLSGVVLTVDVEPTDLVDAAAVGLLGDGRDVEDAETSAVVGLVAVVAEDVLVVVDGLAGRLVVASLLGVLEVTDVPDEGGGVAVGTGAAAVVLVVLVVEDEELLVLGVEDPALVGVGGALVAGDGDELGVLLVGDVVDGEGVLVVAVADLAALVLLVGALVDQALGVVDVAVGGRTAGGGRVGGVAEVKEDETTAALGGARAGTDDVGEARLVVGEDVVGTAVGEVLQGSY